MEETVRLLHSDYSIAQECCEQKSYAKLIADFTFSYSAILL